MSRTLFLMVLLIILILILLLRARTALQNLAGVSS
jgi:hypothetical protein